MNERIQELVKQVYGSKATEQEIEEGDSSSRQL